MIAIDTNLLVYAHRSGVPESAAARQAIEKACLDPHGWGIALPSLGEFWAIVTHPAAQGGPSSGRQAAAFVAALSEAGARIWAPSDGLWRRLLALAAERKIHGARIFDLQIGLTAQEKGATEIWTHDRGFAAPPGLRVVDPL